MAKRMKAAMNALRALQPDLLSISVRKLEVGKWLPDGGADQPVVRVLCHRTTNPRPVTVVPAGL